MEAFEKFESIGSLNFRFVRAVRVRIKWLVKITIFPEVCKKVESVIQGF